MASCTNVRVQRINSEPFPPAPLCIFMSVRHVVQNCTDVGACVQPES